ncbi:MAG: pyrophosphokinae [Actinomycetota bacterium]|nr:pyrophosphokinae [Actinomycetota bacterium]
MNSACAASFAMAAILAESLLIGRGCQGIDYAVRMALSPDEVRARYERERNDYKEQTLQIGGLIRDLLDARGIRYSLESRTKGIEEFCEKAFRPGKKYTDPFSQILDISGIRIVTLLRQEVEDVIGLLRAEFDIDEGNSIDKGADFNANVFGYISKHLILRLDSQRRSQQEYRGALGWAEVQVRTSAQHTWALLDTLVRYKAAEDPPLHVQRRIYGLAALLELVDRENESIVADWDFFATELTNTWLNQPLSASLLERYLNSSEVILSTASYLAERGVGVFEGYDDLALCVRVCTAANISTGIDLQRFIDGVADTSPAFFELLLATHEDQNSLRWTPDTLLVLLIVASDPQRFSETSLTDEFSLGSTWRIILARKRWLNPDMPRAD